MLLSRLLGGKYSEQRGPSPRHSSVSKAAGRTPSSCQPVSAGREVGLPVDLGAEGVTLVLDDRFAEGREVDRFGARDATLVCLLADLALGPPGDLVAERL